MNMTGELFRKMEDIDPKMRDVLLLLMDEVEAKTRIITIGKGDFDQLKNIVQSLAEAQDRTEKRVGELAQTQEQTEKRLGELAQAQEQTEKRLGELAQAQEQTEKRLGELAQTQEQTEKRLGELARAQERTEKAVKTLATGLTDLRKQVGGLSMAVGYGIEDKLMPHARRFASTEFGMEVKLVDRRNMMYPDGGYDEVNLYVEGERNGRKAYLIGECKAQPGKKDFKDFSKRLERIRVHLGGEVLGVLVGYHFDPEVEAFAQDRYPDIRRYRTFEVEGVS